MTGSGGGATGSEEILSEEDSDLYASYLYFDPTAVGAKSQTGQWTTLPNFTDSDAIVFVVGGVSYLESLNLQECVRADNKGRAKAEVRCFSQGFVYCEETFMFYFIFI